MRLFIALNFDEAVKDSICRIQDVLRKACTVGTLTRRNNLHLTLAFLGDCRESQMPDISDAMKSAAGERFTLVSGDAGAFGHSDVRWLGVEKNPHLEGLAARLADELTGRGFSLEDREFVPHITLGRKMILPSGFDKICPTAERTEQEIRHFELMESRWVNGRTVYSPKFSVILG